MTPETHARVMGTNGYVGYLDERQKIHHETGDYLLLHLSDDRAVWVPDGLFSRSSDGSYFLPVSMDQMRMGEKDTLPSELNKPMTSGETHELPKVIPIVQEELEISKHISDSGVRINKRVQTEDEDIAVSGYREHVEVQRVDRNEILDKPVTVRKEGNKLIIPVLEEQIVMEKRLVLKEEIHVTIHHEDVEYAEQIPLRKETVEIQDLDR